MTMGNDLERAVLNSCEALFPEVVAFTQAMVGEYPVLGREHGILGLVEERLKALALPVDRVPMRREELEGHPLYVPVEWDDQAKYNLVSSISPEAPGLSLVLNGHLDVVPAEPAGAWTRPPEVAWTKDGWLYGRGAGDMLSGVGAMIYAVHAIRHAGYRIASPVTIQCVVEEECSGNGALACLERGYGGDFVLIPEPFGAQLYSAQVGVLWFRIAVRGRPAHVLDTTSGSNAIEKLWSLVPALRALEASLNDATRDAPYDAIEHPFNFNLGKISGGNWPSSVPSAAEMECRIGYPPGVTASEIATRVQKSLDDALALDPDGWSEPPVLSFHGFRSDGHVVDLDHEGFAVLADCHLSLTGGALPHYVSTCTTDLRAFHFHSGISGTCYGPVAENIHGTDERVELASVLHTLRAYALFICRWGRVEPQGLEDDELGVYSAPPIPTR